ncbi:shikimate O-hydroxycinnamoyltransferase-like [Olea europaea subsp. europaea]|uniref:Shikimate O-hydroxycinnamoyltransferase-like n=1 Tax=Olea europaea subsp. europaea TaxID=158383 RepID=A0A8S0S5J5_OLEEU|nr:shikimate O-hydroxycinnamoyltransferase-like [Olea europaea subsp. europaea]
MMHVKRDFEVKLRKNEVVGPALPIQENRLPLFQSRLALATGRCQGELMKNEAREPKLLCNNRGVDFVKALADVEIKDLDLHISVPNTEDIVVLKGRPRCATQQATQLKCGGMVVACTFSHQMAEAYSANMFLVSWAEMALSKQHVRSNISSAATLLANADNGSSSSKRKMTKLEAFSAFLWKMIAAGEFNRTNKFYENQAKLIEPYFGNVLSIPFGEKNIEELKERPLSWIANEIHEFLESAVTKEHFLGLIDWVEDHRPEPWLAKIYCSGPSEEEPTVVVSSGQHFPVKKMNFGWGEPCFGMYHFPWGGKSGYVMPMPSPKGNGDWIVYMHLLKGQLELI